MTTKAAFSAEILEHILDLPEGVHIERFERIPGEWNRQTQRAGSATFIAYLVKDDDCDFDLPKGRVLLNYEQHDGKVILTGMTPQEPISTSG